MQTFNGVKGKWIFIYSNDASYYSVQLSGERIRKSAQGTAFQVINKNISNIHKDWQTIHQ